MPRAALFLALVMMLAFSRAAAADCPTNSMAALGTTQLSSNPSGSLTQTYTCTADGFPVYTAGTAFYNLPVGRVYASAQGGIGCSGSAQASTHDIFTLTGPASGSPISLRAQLNVFTSGYGNGIPFAGAGIREGASNSSSSTVFPGPSTIGITISVSPGSSFDLYMNAGAGGGYWGSANAAVDAYLGFPNLPPGYLLQSCQGFVVGAVVPVRPVSWGRLKTLYR